MVKQSRALLHSKGILSSPEAKCGKSVDGTTVTLIKTFYESDEVSRVMPGRKDCISLKTDNGRIAVQKRLVLSNLREVYNLFKEQHPNSKVGFSKFASLRPKNCVLAGASGTHSVCVCEIHQNVKLMLEALRGNCDMSQKSSFMMDYSSLLKHIICDNPSPKCYFNECEKCPGVETLRFFFEEFFTSNSIEFICYHQWVSTDRSTLISLIVLWRNFQSY